MEAERRIDLRDYLQIARRRALPILVVVVGAVGATWYWSSRADDRYVASVQVLIRAPGGTALTGGGTSLSTADAQREIANEIRVVQSRQVQADVAQQLGFVPAMSVSADQFSDVVTLQAAGSTGADAARAANIYAAAYIEVRRSEINNDLIAASGLVQQKIDDISVEIDDLDKQISTTVDPEELNGLQAERAARVQQEILFRSRLDDLQINAAVRGSGAEVVSEAVAPSRPVSPTPRRDAFLALVLSAVLAFGLALTLEFLDDSVRSPRQVDVVLAGAAPVLGRIPHRRRRDRRRALIEGLTSPRGHVTEAYRAARSAVLARLGSRSGVVIQITSPTDAEERSTVAVGLAIGLVPSGRTVLLVSADLRSDRLSRMLRVPTVGGLVDALTDPKTVDRLIALVPGGSSLWALSTGTVTPANAEILASPLAKDLFRELRDRFDVIIVDGPPVLGNADSAVLAGLCDTTIVVVEASSSRRRDIARALDDLTLVGAEVTGVIMTEVGRAESVD